MYIMAKLQKYPHNYKPPTRLKTKKMEFKNFVVINK